MALRRPIPASQVARWQDQLVVQGPSTDVLRPPERIGGTCSGITFMKLFGLGLGIAVLVDASTDRPRRSGELVGV